MYECVTYFHFSEHERCRKRQNHVDSAKTNEQDDEREERKTKEALERGF
jgi:hypothetical protein